MASGPITSCQTDGKTMETAADFILEGAPKITADGDCSHEFKTLTPWKKGYDQTRQHIKKQRHVFLVKAMGFPVVMNMNGCEIRTIKNVEHRGEMLLNCGVGEDS